MKVKETTKQQPLKLTGKLNDLLLAALEPTAKKGSKKPPAKKK